MKSQPRHAPASLLVMGLLVLSLGACAATSPERRITQADGLADAGIAFADTLPPLYDAFFLQSVQADSIGLEQQRGFKKKTLPTAQQGAAKEELLGLLQDSDEDLEQTAQIVRDLKRHARLLKSYFLALKSLASEETGAEIPGAAQQAVADLQKLDVDVAKKQFFSKGLGDVVGPVASFAVDFAKASALKKELELRGAVINREIARQEAALDIIAQRMAGDRQLVLIKTVKNPLDSSFIDLSKTVSTTWWKKRADYLMRNVGIEEVGRAEDAARNLRSAWEAFAAGRPSDPLLAVIIADLQAVRDLVSSLAAANGP